MLYQATIRLYKQTSLVNKLISFNSCANDDVLQSFGVFFLKQNKLLPICLLMVRRPQTEKTEVFFQKSWPTQQ